LSLSLSFFAAEPSTAPAIKKAQASNDAANLIRELPD
jgi:hypothetical protein